MRLKVTKIQSLKFKKHKYGDLDKWNKVSALCKSKAQYRCQICGKSEGLETHHIIPISKGGSSYGQSNLKCLCKSCHTKQHKHLYRLKK